MTVTAIFSTHSPLRIGTRSSPLALAQAHLVANVISMAHDLAPGAVTLVPMLASGDKVQDRPLAEIGGKALWTKELERALLDGEIDIAVHSMKDVETVRNAAFAVTAMLPRADVRDRLIGAASVADLASGARVGTSSPRRAAQLLRQRPDLNIVPLRGNVATRLRHIGDGNADATLLAAAGLDRLAMASIGAAIATTELLPAASQGAIGIDHLADRTALAAFLAPVNDPATFQSVMAERAFLQALGGTCHSPVAALAHSGDTEILLRAEILSADGGECHAGEIRFSHGDNQAPQQLAAELLSRASPELAALFAP